MARRLALAGVIALVVLALALCARPRPEVGLTISGTTTPVRLDFVVGNEVEQINGAIW